MVSSRVERACLKNALLLRPKCNVCFIEITNNLLKFNFSVSNIVMLLQWTRCKSVKGVSLSHLDLKTFSNTLKLTNFVC